MDGFYEELAARSGGDPPDLEIRTLEPSDSDHGPLRVLRWFGCSLLEVIADHEPGADPGQDAGDRPQLHLAAHAALLLHAGELPHATSLAFVIPNVSRSKQDQLMSEELFRFRADIERKTKARRNRLRTIATSDLTTWTPRWDLHYTQNLDTDAELLNEPVWGKDTVCGHVHDWLPAVDDAGAQTRPTGQTGTAEVGNRAGCPRCVTNLIRLIKALADARCEQHPTVPASRCLVCKPA